MTVLIPGEFGNYNNKTVEIIRRIFLVLLSPILVVATLIGSLSAIVFNLVGDVLLVKQPYLCLLGNYRGAKQSKIATFNMATLLPPMTPIDGVDYCSERLKNIANDLRNFQFVCGQEVDGASARFFAKELKNDFAVFYTYLGKSNAPLIPSGLFFASKEKPLSVNVVPFTAPSVQKAIKREVVIFEFEKFCVATMHLDGGDGPQVIQTHLAEIQQAAAALKTYNKPVILCGDFNENRYAPSSAYQELMKHFNDPIAAIPDFMTCTNELKLERFGKDEPPTLESIDYIAPTKDSPLTLRDLQKLYRFNNSDHSLVSASIVVNGASYA